WRSTAPESARQRQAALPARTPARNRTWQRKYRRCNCRAPDRTGSTSLHLGDDRRRPLAADQPPHAEEIHDPDPEPIEEAVVGHAGMARPVDHVDIGDLIAFP